MKIVTGEFIFAVLIKDNVIIDLKAYCVSIYWGNFFISIILSDLCFWFICSVFPVTHETVCYFLKLHA